MLCNPLKMPSRWVTTHENQLPAVCVCRLYLDLKVVVCVREEDHFLFIPKLRVIGLDPSTDPPPLTTQSHHHLVT